MITLALVVLASAVAQPVSDPFSEVFDPVGDTGFVFTPPFQDVFRARMTKTASGGFELLMEMVDPVPANPPLPPGRSEIWWLWAIDLDRTTFPPGYPFRSNYARPPEIMVYVSWDGTAFAGTAIDRRPLLTGGEAIITSVPFSFSADRRIVEADLPSTVIGYVPTSLRWAPFTADWAGPVGSEGFWFVDYFEAPWAVFNP